MPASRTNNHTPEKVYFSASEARKILDCSKDWLYVWTRQLGFKTKIGQHHRYSIEEINRLTVIRKTNGVYRDVKTGKFQTIPRLKKKGRFKRKGIITAETDRVEESKNGLELR